LDPASAPDGDRGEFAQPGWGLSMIHC
jgi:hypothetical protein